MLYREYPFVKIEVEEENQSIIMSWSGSFTSELYREAMDYSLDLVASKNLKYWLTNSSNIGLIKPEDQNWTSQTLLPRLSELGVEKVAIIVPDDLNSHMAIASIMVNGKESITFDMHYFVKKEDAAEWFKLLD